MIGNIIMEDHSDRYYVIDIVNLKIDQSDLGM